jgi:hypothetical protein
MRLQIVGITISCALLLTLITIGSYIVNAPGETREVSGSMVSFKTETSGSDIRVDHWLHVRLDSGLTVTARVSPRVPVKVGQRVNLIATKMPIIGIERFRFKEFIKPPVNPNPHFQN